MTLKPGLEMWTSEIKEEFSLILSALRKWALSFLSPQCPSTLKSGGSSWNGSKHSPMNEWVKNLFVTVFHHGNIGMSLVFARHPLFSIKFTYIILTATKGNVTIYWLNIFFLSQMKCKCLYGLEDLLKECWSLSTELFFWKSHR